MLATTLALALLAQDPGGPTGGGGARLQRASALVVEGDIELSRADAERSALDRARLELRDRQVARGRAIAEESAPVWVPAFLSDRVVREWLDRTDFGAQIQVLDRETAVHDYSYGKAYRTTLVVDDPPSAFARAFGRAGERAPDSVLRHDLRRAGKLFLAKCGGIAAFWGLLAFLCAWFDRLSRGYMTWRLRLITVLMAVPALPLALIF